MSMRKGGTKQYDWMDREDMQCEKCLWCGVSGRCYGKDILGLTTGTTSLKVMYRMLHKCSYLKKRKK